MEIKSLEDFKIVFSKNLSDLIAQNFKTKKEFASFINENAPNISKWCNGNALPEFYTIYKICANFDISIDSLITNRKSELRDHNIDYIVFDEVIELVNNYAKKHRIKKVSSEEYFNMYYSILHWNESSEEQGKRRISTKDTFEILEPIIISHLRKDFIPK